MLCVRYNPHNSSEFTSRKWAVGTVTHGLCKATYCFQRRNSYVTYSYDDAHIPRVVESFTLRSEAEARRFLHISRCPLAPQAVRTILMKHVFVFCTLTWDISRPHEELKMSDFSVLARVLWVHCLTSFGDGSLTVPRQTWMLFLPIKWPYFFGIICSILAYTVSCSPGTNRNSVIQLDYA